MQRPQQQTNTITMFTTNLVLAKNPAGTWSFKGQVPEILAYIRHDGQPLTDEDRQVIQHCGPGFRKKQVKSLTFSTCEEALQTAKDNGFTVGQVFRRNDDNHSKAKT